MQELYQIGDDSIFPSSFYAGSVPNRWRFNCHILLALLFVCLFCLWNIRDAYFQLLTIMISLSLTCRQITSHGNKAVICDIVVHSNMCAVVRNSSILLRILVDLVLLSAWNNSTQVLSVFSFWYPILNR